MWENSLDRWVAFDVSWSLFPYLACIIRSPIRLLFSASNRGDNFPLAVCTIQPSILPSWNYSPKCHRRNSHFLCSDHSLETLCTCCSSLFICLGDSLHGLLTRWLLASEFCMHWEGAQSGHWRHQEFLGKKLKAVLAWDTPMILRRTMKQQYRQRIETKGVSTMPSAWTLGCISLSKIGCSAGGARWSFESVASCPITYTESLLFM